MTTYDIFCQWCIDHHRNPPTREWWDWACKLPAPKRDPVLAQVRLSTGLDDFQFDVDTERREGWAYGQNL